MLVFLDEYGNSSLKPSGQPLARYLSVAALCVRHNYYQDILLPRYRVFKANVFGDPGIYLHYRALFHRLPPFDEYSDEQIARTWQKIVRFLGSLDVKLRCVCIDKLALMGKIPLWEKNPHKDPYELALALHIERIVFHLDTLGKRQTQWAARVVAESRTPQQNRLVNEAYMKIWSSGHLLFDQQGTLSPKRIQTAIPRHDLPFRSKGDKVEGLELVDLITNPLTWATIFEYHADTRPLRERDQHFMGEVGHLIDKDIHGRTKGWGLKLYPTK